MIKALEYKIVYGSSDQVEREVNDLTDRGWTIYGSVQVSSFNGSAVFTQVMVKEKQIRGPWD